MFSKKSKRYINKSNPLWIHKMLGIGSFYKGEREQGIIENNHTIHILYVVWQDAYFHDHVREHETVKKSKLLSQIN